jgi:hypothetical protein
MSVVAGVYVINQLVQPLTIGVRDDNGALGSVVVPSGAKLGPYWYSRVETQAFEYARRGMLVMEYTTINISDPLEPDLAWWKLDETSGSTATDSIGSYTIPVVGATWDRGLICSGDGINGIAAASVPTRWRQPSFSVSIWITPYIRNDLIDQGPPSYYKPAPGSAYSLDIPGQGGPGVMAHLVESANTASTDSFADTLITGGINGLLKYPGRTFHVLMVHGAVTDALYLDGVLVASGPSVGMTEVASTFRIGYHNSDTGYGTSRFFKGRVQDIRVYGRDLSAADAIALHAAGPVGFNLGAQLESYMWPVSRMTGSTFNCIDNPSAAGTITGSVSWDSNGVRWHGATRGLADVSLLPDLPVGDVPCWMSCVVAVSDLSPAYGQFIAYGQSGSGSRMLGLFYSKHPDAVMSWFIPGVSSGYFAGGLIPTDGLFHHYLVSYTPRTSDAVLALWIDGIAVGGQAIPKVNFLKERLYLGEDAVGQTDGVEGYIRNVRLGLGTVDNERAERLWLADRIPTIPVAPVYTRYMSVTPSALYGYTAPLVSDQPPVGNIVVENAYPQAGYAFVRWSSSDSTFNGDVRSPDNTTTMPARNIHIVAEFGASTTYTLTLIAANGTLSSGEGTLPDAVPGSRWIISAPYTPGFAFDHWEVTPAALIGITDPVANPAIFAMPSADVTVEAIYVISLSYPVTVNAGNGSGDYLAGDTVYLSPATPYGYAFAQWTGSLADLALINPYEPFAYFTMPSRSVTLTATFTLGQYYASVYLGSGSGVYAYGDTVNITADPVDPGWEFGSWYSYNYVAFADPYDPSTSFPMPGEEAYVEAVWDPIYYNLTLVGGTSSTGTTFTVLYGFSITADEPPPGDVFLHWEGDTTYLDDPNAATAYVMAPPAMDLSFTAVFVTPH